MLHRFSRRYFSWRNGLIERLSRERLQATREILSNLQLPPEHWPELLPIF